MSYITSKELMLDAQKGHYAVGAFNIENMEMAQAAIAAAEELSAPIILQTTPSTLKYATPATFCGMVKSLAEVAKVPVALHLDHGSSYELAAACADAGYSTVMIDGSHDSFEDNIAVSKKTVEYAKTKGIPVEAELGKVGGKEDDLDGGSGNYTDPQEAKEFVERTGIDSLAVAIGTAHGIYKTTPILDKNRLKEIRAVVDIPLVLHGASGLLAQDMIDCVELGICKINFATELRIAYTKGVMAYMEKDPKVFDPKKYGAVGRQYVQDLVKEKIMICGSNGKY
ncbi:MAG: ketose-bisphosphate aldolase [Eubacteriales bacterium]